jgi:2-iminobutanoate/2-iminopropanoate deaminase
MDKSLVSPSTIWDPAEHLFSQCVAVTGVQQTLYLAGQTSIDAHGTIVGVDDVEQQIRLAFANIAAIVTDAGGSLDNVVKLTAYFLDMTALDIYTRVLGEIFPTMRPAQTVVQVVRLAMPELLVELDATAVL